MPRRLHLLSTGAALAGLLALVGASATASAVGAGPDNRRFSNGLEGWTVEGREPVQLSLVAGRPRALLARNTSLVTPPTTVPADAQAFGILARAPRGRALIIVRAIVEGQSPVRLGVLEPGGRLEEHLVSVAGLSGQVARFELDPVTSLGRTVQLGGVGPFRAPLKGWDVIRGVASPLARRAGRYSVDGPLRANRGLRLPRGTEQVSVRLRGEGSVQLTVSGVRRRLRADSQWKTLRVSVRKGTRRASIALLAQPGFGSLEIANLGAASRA